MCFHITFTPILSDKYIKVHLTDKKGETYRLQTQVYTCMYVFKDKEGDLSLKIH